MRGWPLEAGRDDCGCDKVDRRADPRIMPEEGHGGDEARRFGLDRPPMKTYCS
jgi:hypothetical protein